MARAIGERLARAQRGDFAGLLADVEQRRRELQTDGCRTTTATEEEDEAMQRIRAVISLVKRGGISRAAQRLQSDGVAAGTDAVEAKLRSMLHCDASEPLPDAT